jgi:hypothetical protein
MIYIFSGVEHEGSESKKELKVNSKRTLFKQSQKPLKQNDCETILLYLIYHKTQGLTKAMRTKVEQIEKKYSVQEKDKVRKLFSPVRLFFSLFSAL